MCNTGPYTLYVEGGQTFIKQIILILPYDIIKGFMLTAVQYCVFAWRRGSVPEC